MERMENIKKRLYRAVDGWGDAKEMQPIFIGCNRVATFTQVYIILGKYLQEVDTNAISAFQKLSDNSAPIASRN